MTKFPDEVRKGLDSPDQAGKVNDLAAQEMKNILN